MCVCVYVRERERERKGNVTGEIEYRKGQMYDEKTE